MSRTSSKQPARGNKPQAGVRKRPGTKTLPRTTSFLSGGKLIALLCVPLAALTVMIYTPVLANMFVVYDDREYITGNPHIREGLSWNAVKWAFKSTDASNWHPLTWLSHALDYQLFGLSPAGHHLDSVAIHALNVALLFLLLGWVTKRVGPSLLVAALFAVHPFNVESVAWAAERKNVLSTLFFFLAIGAYAWYARKPGWRRYLLVAALFAAGLMAKPMVITLPFVLLLLDHWPLERLQSPVASPQSPVANQQAFWKLAREKVPLLLLSAASAWITLKAQRAGHAVRSFDEFPFGVRVENAVVAYGLYLWKMLWPARLALYPHSPIPLPAWQWLLSALVLAVVTGAVITFRRERYLPVGWFWYLGTLVPVIGLVQVGEASMADRYAYVPLVGIFIMIAWSLADWAEAKKIRAVWLVIPAVCVLTALSCVTYRQIGYWESQYSLLAHTLAVTDPMRSAYTHDALGVALMYPDQAMTQHDLESFDTRQQRLDEARRQFEQALDVRRQLGRQDLEPYAMALALVNLGHLDGAQHRGEEARRDFEEALVYYRRLAQKDPENYLPSVADTLMDLAGYDWSQRQMDEARQHNEEAARIYRQLAQNDPNKYLPSVAKTLYNLGFLDQAQNRTEEARANYQEAWTLFSKLSQRDKEYAKDVARVEASLEALERTASGK